MGKAFREPGPPALSHLDSLFASLKMRQVLTLPAQNGVQLISFQGNANRPRNAFTYSNARSQEAEPTHDKGKSPYPTPPAEGRE